MTIQYSVAERTAQAAQLQAIGGANATLRIFGAAQPNNTTLPDPTPLLVTMVLPPVFLAAANGQATMLGSWTGTAIQSGTALSFRLYDSNSQCFMQGNCSTDLVVNNPNIPSGQIVTVSQFTVTVGNP